MEHQPIPLPDPPAIDGTLTQRRAALGAPVDPLRRIQIMSPSEWERFTLEWAHSLKNDYAKVELRGGSGDQGRDVMASVTLDPGSIWDNYQCKHLSKALAPHNVWVEIGKICYYAHKGEYTLPRHCYFIAPLFASGTLLKLLDKPTQLKADLFDAWDARCRTNITTTADVILDASLRSFIESMDFSMFRVIHPVKLIEQHSRTPWHTYTFGGELPERGPVEPPPAAIGEQERTYVRALLDAYEERLGRPIVAADQIADDLLFRHFSRSREEFFHAEFLRVFSRDNIGPRTFEDLKSDIEAGVIDVYEGSHTDAVERVKAVVTQAKSLPISANALVDVLTSRDRGGICHHLANDGKFKWRT